MPQTETEWSLQKRLTRSWLHDEVAVLDGEPLFLAAWEVMTDYRINDARRHWSAPSIDFVFLDRVGRLVLVELKRTVMTPRESWSVVCQVTHRAQVLAGGFSASRLEGAFHDCRSGADGRVIGSTSYESLLESHSRAFNQPALSELPGLPLRRFVMAKEFGTAFGPVLEMVNSRTRSELVSVLGRYKPRGEIKRYLELAVDPRFVDSEPIRAFIVNDKALTFKEVLR